MKKKKKNTLKECLYCGVMISEPYFKNHRKQCPAQFPKLKNDILRGEHDS